MNLFFWRKRKGLAGAARAKAKAAGPDANPKRQAFVDQQVQRIVNEVATKAAWGRFELQTYASDDESWHDVVAALQKEGFTATLALSGPATVLNVRWD